MVGSALSIGSLDVRPIGRTEYERMIEVGLFAEDERIELLYGALVRMSAKGPVHDSVLEHLTEVLVVALAGQARVRVQSAFAASNESEPEPDIAVVPLGDYRSAHPSVAHLIIEVADSSLTIDRETKGALYAASGVPEYWIVNCAHRVLEVHQEPMGGIYGRKLTLTMSEIVRPLAFPKLEVHVARLFGSEPERVRTKRKLRKR